MTTVNARYALPRAVDLPDVCAAGVIGSGQCRQCGCYRERAPGPDVTAVWRSLVVTRFCSRTALLGEPITRAETHGLASGGGSDVTCKRGCADDRYHGDLAVAAVRVSLKSPIVGGIAFFTTLDADSLRPARPQSYTGRFMAEHILFWNLVSGVACRRGAGNGARRCARPCGVSRCVPGASA